MNSKYASKIQLNKFQAVSSKFSMHDTVECPIITAHIRKPAPNITGMTWWNDKFVPINNTTFKGKWVCLFFYPLDFTFVCPTEIVDFEDHVAEFEKLSKIFKNYF